jgi:hypothetical protein
MVWVDIAPSWKARLIAEKQRVHPKDAVHASIWKHALRAEHAGSGRRASHTKWFCARY